jgi:hypothetical protein
MYIKNILKNAVAGAAALAALLSIIPAAHADLLAPTFNIPLGKKTDLIYETKSLKLQKEDTVQKTNPQSNFFLGMLGGTVQPSLLSVESYGHVMNYEFAKPLPVITAQVSHYPFTWHGRWGWSASASYAYGEYDTGSVKTSLHMMPAQVNAAYRAEYKSTQKLIPYLMVGPTVWNYFQRGTDEFNTSGTVFSGGATAGLSLNLNRLGWVSGRNDTEVLLQYQRQFTNKGTVADLSGNTFEIGGTLAL